MNWLNYGNFDIRSLICRSWSEFGFVYIFKDIFASHRTEVWAGMRGTGGFDQSLSCLYLFVLFVYLCICVRSKICIFAPGRVQDRCVSGGQVGSGSLWVAACAPVGLRTLPTNSPLVRRRTHSRCVRSVQCARRGHTLGDKVPSVRGVRHKDVTKTHLYSAS